MIKLFIIQLNFKPDIYLLNLIPNLLIFSKPLLTMNSETHQKQYQGNKQNGVNQSPQQINNKMQTLKSNFGEAIKHYIVVETKKKKEVIQISSQESDVINKPKDSQNNLTLNLCQGKGDKTKKIKKTVFKCQMCKGIGKKNQMKICMNCKFNFHTGCIGNYNELLKKVICGKCRFLKEQQFKSQEKKQNVEQKQVNIEPQKNQPKKTEKQKKKQEYTKRLNQFIERYPYYFQDEQKIKYPIQDKLLIIYRQLFEINENTRPKPNPHPFIPSNLIADFLQIQNFFSTFQEQLVEIGNYFPKYLKKNYLFSQMNNSVIDKCYSSMLYCLIKIYLSDIFEKNKTENVKMLNENCFFTLLTNMNENEDLDQTIIIPSATEILRYLSTIPSMKKSFEDFELPEVHDLAGKISILANLVNGLSEIDTFHELVAVKSQKMQNLTKQKGQLINQLKVDEAQNLQNKQKIKQFANVDIQLDEQLNQNDQNGTMISTRQLTKEKDKNKKKIQKLTNEKDKSERNIQQIRLKISQISKTVPFVTSQVVFVGKDRNQSQYYFNSNEPSRIYCHYHQYLLDENKEFYVYEGKQSINELLKSFNVKGLHEKHLADTISYFIKEEIINDNDIDSKQIQNIQPNIQNTYPEITRDEIIKIVLELETTFSNYLVMKSLQWAPLTQRQNILDNLKFETDLQQIKKIINTIQESFLFVEPMSEESSGRFNILDSDEQAKQQRRESKKKSPVRLWGINSERIKKYWVEYLEQSIDLKGVWICANILKNYVNRYVSKKMEFLIEQQKKEEKIQKQKDRKERTRLRKQKEEKESDKLSRDRSRDDKPRRGRPRKNIEIFSDSEPSQSNRPYLRQRKKLKFQIDSDISVGKNGESESAEISQSENDDRCAICAEYGEMICCDTCPKVFHLECLKIKQIPDGDWSCIECLGKIANSRQTRSKAKQIKKGLRI